MERHLGLNVVNMFFPAILSAIILYALVVVINQSQGGPSISILYTLSLFIAGGYFFIAATLLHVMKLLGNIAKPEENTTENLKKEIETLEKVKKDFEKKYLFGKISEKTFRRQIDSIDQKIIYCQEQISDLEKKKK